VGVYDDTANRENERGCSGQGPHPLQGRAYFGTSLFEEGGLTSVRHTCPDSASSLAILGKKLGTLEC